MIKDDPELSFVIPCHNEEGNLSRLVAQIRDVMRLEGLSYEVIIHDDGSTDNSWGVLKEIARTDGCLRVYRFKDNVGESAASFAGMQRSRGRYIVTLDADLQNDLSDLPRFLKALETYDCVCGSRVTTRRNGDSMICRASSRFANWVRNKILEDNITDSGCTYRAFRRACLAKIKFFNGAHRFLPALLKMEGFSVTEITIKNNPRLYGKSHYGVWKRFFKSFVDLCGVWWMKDRMIRYEVVDQGTEG